jgi:hypothetical protein
MLLLSFDFLWCVAHIFTSFLYLHPLYDVQICSIIWWGLMSHCRVSSLGSTKFHSKLTIFVVLDFCYSILDLKKNCQLEWEWFWFRQLPLVLALTFAWMDDRYGTLFLSHISEDINNSPNFSGGLDWIINVGMSSGFLVACLDIINES